MAKDRAMVGIDREIWELTKEAYKENEKVLRRIRVDSPTALVEEAILDYLENELGKYVRAWSKRRKGNKSDKSATEPS